MHIFRLVLLTACLLCTQRARADMFDDCNKSCDLSLRSAQCSAIAKLPNMSDQVRGRAYARVCAAYLLTGTVERDAFDACIQAATLEPTAVNHSNLGVAKIIISAHRSAIKSLSVAIELDPAMSNAYFNRAIAHERRGERKAALADYKQARLLGDKTAHRSIKKLVRPTLPTRR